jgi:hypothetical protein
MRDIGYIILDLKANQLNDTIIKYAEESQGNNCFKEDIIFSTNNELINSPNLPILHISQSKFFYGDLFLFDTNSISLTSESPNIENRYFYATNIPWVNNHHEYKYWVSLFHSNNLQIIASNQQIFDIYNICWKKPLGISETFNYDTISRFIQ